MEVESPKSKTGKRRYVRKRPFQDTPARAAARVANFEKMVAAPKEKRYRPSAKRDAANPKNLEKGRAVLRQRVAAREQQQLCERLQTLFPAYPPKEEPGGNQPPSGVEEKGEKGKGENGQEPISPLASPASEGVGTKPECDVESTDNRPTSPLRIQPDAGIGDSEFGARQPELGDSGRHTEPKSGIPKPEPRTPDPDPEGVGTKPECAVESTDSSPTSPSRIQHDAGIGDSGFGAREPELGDSGRDTEPKSGIPNPEPRTPDPDSEGVGTKPECDIESTDSSPTSPSRIQHDAGIGDSEFGAREPELGDSGGDPEPKSGIPNPEPRTPDPDSAGVGTKPECDVESTDSSPTSRSRIQDQDQPQPGPIPEHQDKPQSEPSGTAAADQSANGNHQSAIPEDPNPFLPDSATALLPWPSASGSVAVTSPAKHDAKAAK